MTLRRHRSAFLRLILSASLLTALFLAQPAHTHSSLAAPDVCAPCSWSLHAPTALVVPVALALVPTVFVAIVPADDDGPTSRPLTTARPRSPPLA